MRLRDGDFDRRLDGGGSSGGGAIEEAQVVQRLLLRTRAELKLPLLRRATISEHPIVRRGVVVVVAEARRT
jgi:hypothetical protein